MSRIHWRRPLVLAVASVAIATGTACAAQASPSVTTGISQVAPAGHSHCGRGGEGGKGGAPGEPGEPGKPGRPGCLTFGDLPDKPKSELTIVDKLRIVLTVEYGHVKKADVAKKYKISEKEIDTWEKQFREGDWAALVDLNSLFGS
ncbi:helix-turn-helix domain-containing protein [Streptomyces sp. NPDC086549]|uniref:helix-turn-helix domain-containing protein n=1 Tax=Streptomyces sp. NPDC086549 TaxID=3365752 RepID=UPI0037FD0095